MSSFISSVVSSISSCFGAPNKFGRNPKFSYGLCAVDEGDLTSYLSYTSLFLLSSLSNSSFKLFNRVRMLS